MESSFLGIDDERKEETGGQPIDDENRLTGLPE
jgi:hypothetical protein